MPLPEKCPICLRDDLKAINSPGSKDTYLIECKYCGEYEISRLLTKIQGGGIEDYGSRSLLSSIIRNRSDDGLKTDFHSANIQNFFKSTFIPENPKENIDHLIYIIGKYTKRPGKKHSINLQTDYPLFFASDYQEAKFYLDSSISLGMVEPPREVGSGYALTLNGWMNYEKIVSGKKNANRAFVAMWFNEETDSAWEKGLLPALEICGYQAVRIDKEEHNEKICDRIVAEIRRSELLIADFTGQRNGVYFEAGLAMGLNKQVIWTCHENDIDNLHFDTRQYNHIVWSSPTDLKKKMVDRINATIKI